MTRRSRLAALPLASIAAVVAGGACFAVAVGDVVTTKDGLVLEGRVTREADGVVVHTDSGDIRLASGSVASVRDGDGPRTAAKKALADTKSDDAVGRYRLALQFERQGLRDLAREAYESIIAVEADHPAARRALGYERVDGKWLTTTQANTKRGLLLYEGRWMLPAEMDLRTKATKKTPRTVTLRPSELLEASRAAAMGSPALARAASERIVSASAGDRLESATALLVHPEPRMRSWATMELGRLGDQSALRPLWAVAARDRNEDVRHAAVNALASFGRDDIAIPLIRGLGSEHASIVRNSAQALMWLGDGRSVAYIVKRIVSHGGSPGAYFSDMVQQAYVQDFDVEVAQTSFIADPIIGTVQDGAVQDVKVLDAMIEQTIVETVLINSLNALAKTSFKDPSKVAAWWAENKGEFPGFNLAAAKSAADVTGTGGSK